MWDYDNMKAYASYICYIDGHPSREELLFIIKDDDIRNYEKIIKNIKQIQDINEKEIVEIKHGR